MSKYRDKGSGEVVDVSHIPDDFPPGEWDVLIKLHGGPEAAAYIRVRAGDWVVLFDDNGVYRLGEEEFKAAFVPAIVMTSSDSEPGSEPT